MNDTTNNARAHLRVKRRPYEPHGSIKAAVLRLVKKAGAQGIHYATLVDSIKGSTRQSINTTTKRLVAAGELVRRSQGQLILLWPAGTPVEQVDAVFGEVLEARRHFVGERDRGISRRSSEKARRAKGSLPMAQHLERLKAGWRNHHMLETKANAEARAAVRKEQSEARKLAADLKRLEEAERAKAARKTVKQVTRDTQAINRLAAKVKGTVSPTAIVPKPAKPGPVEIPRHMVTVERPMTLPHERIQPTGSFGRIGQYDTEPSTWAKAVAA